MKSALRDFVECLPQVAEVVRGCITDEVCSEATKVNPWFSESDIHYAVEAICNQYLVPNKVAEWLAQYPTLPTTEPKRIGVVAAGNIPLAAFFDILCTITAGHHCRVKYSSKDSVLLPTVCNALASQLGWPIEPMELGSEVDALIASGSDTAMEKVGKIYSTTPTLLRGHRSSVAVLDGSESEATLSLLAQDCFRYNSMGCRNVTLIFAPKRLATEEIITHLCCGKELVAQGYLNNYRQAIATAMLTGREIINGGHFVMEERWEFPISLAQVNIVHYDTLAQVQEWLATHDNEIQCIATNCAAHPRSTPIGEAQCPSLTDWPDGVDVMHFLAEIH